jgi:hypothetical protein
MRCGEGFGLTRGRGARGEGTGTRISRVNLRCVVELSRLGSAIK